MKNNQKRNAKREEIRIGKRIRMVRLMAGLRQDELAYKLKVSPAQISTWERDEVEPGVYACVLIAEALGISMDQLIGWKAIDPFEVYLRN